MTDITFTKGDPDDGSPDLQQLRLRDQQTVAGIVDRLIELFGAEPEFQMPDMDDRIKAFCRRQGWLAMPLPGDRFWQLDEDNREVTTYLTWASMHGSSAVLANLWSPEEISKGGNRNKLFIRGENAPALDLYEVPSVNVAQEAIEYRHWYGLLTTTNIDFVVMEDDGSHILAGPPELVRSIGTPAECTSFWKNEVNEAWYADDKSRAEHAAYIDGRLAMYREFLKPNPENETTGDDLA